jgi:hypothetical protein
MPVVWMIGACAVSWAVLAATARQVNPEALFGMLGPLASASVTWVVVARMAAAAPARVTGVMVTGLAVKMVFFSVYVIGMLKGAGLRPVPFIVSFAGYFIVLHAMEAVFLRRLFAEMVSATPGRSAVEDSRAQRTGCN